MTDLLGSEILVDPGAIFPLSDPADPAGPYVAGWPVGPGGMLSPFFSDPAGPAGFVPV